MRNRGRGIVSEEISTALNAERIVACAQRSKLSRLDSLSHRGCVILSSMLRGLRVTSKRSIDFSPLLSSAQ